MKITGLGDLVQAAGGLRKTVEASRRAAYRAANAVLGKVETQARRDIAAQVNLPQSYIRDLTRTTKAGPNQPAAYIRMRIRAVRLARFDARQITAVAPRAKGDPRRGIPPGRKRAGVSVKVGRKGGRKSMRGAFLLPLRAGGSDGGNGMGVFVRTGKGPRGIKHLYGPSPDQLFRRWRAEAAPDIRAMLVKAYASQLRYEIKGSRK
jgi:hypothetical protein